MGAAQQCLLQAVQHDSVLLFLQAVPLEQLSEASVLDWLCLHVDPAHLPKRYC